MKECKITGERGGLFKLSFPYGFENNPLVEVYNFDFKGGSVPTDMIRAIASYLVGYADEVDLNPKLIQHERKELTQRHALEARNAELLEALKKAHEILLHEMDNGRTPSMLQGVGLGYFEDVIAGID